MTSVTMQYQFYICNGISDNTQGRIQEWLLATSFSLEWIIQYKCYFHD